MNGDASSRRWPVGGIAGASLVVDLGRCGPACPNAELTIARAEDSVLAQRFGGWILTVVDDRSTKRTSYVARWASCGDACVEILRCEPETPRQRP